VNAWIAVDLDGTLAEYHGWNGGAIGSPVPAMVARVKHWLRQGRDVRIFTARISLRNGITEEERDAQHAVIEAWCQEHLGEILPITCEKDYGMVELWDDRCVQVEQNTGKVVGDVSEQAEEGK
jgi:hypothetical protein